MNSSWAASQATGKPNTADCGDNTTASPRLTTDSTGRVFDGFIIARPLEWLDSSHQSNLGVVARFDHFTPNTSPTAATYAGSTPSYNFWILGASYDVTQRITLAADWQKQSGTNFPAPLGTNVRATPDNSTIFLHFQASF